MRQLTPMDGTPTTRAAGCQASPARLVNRITTSALCCAALALLTGCGGSGGGPNRFTVSATAGAGGSISPTTATVAQGNTASFTLAPDSGFTIDSVTGCSGSLTGSTYTTGPITADCAVSASFVSALPSAARLSLDVQPIKTFLFSWEDVEDATHYRLLENPDGISGFVQLGPDIVPSVESFDHVAPLYARLNAQYILQSCNTFGCTDSATVTVDGTLVEAIGYFKASNTDAGDLFGTSVSLSADGMTFAVGAALEDSGAVGVDGDQRDNTRDRSGAVYVFHRRNETWTQQGYLKASNTDANDAFGDDVSLSADGNTLVVGARGEESDATGIDGDQGNNSADSAGAVYVFERTADVWAQQAYVKASNTDAGDWFGHTLSLSGRWQYSGGRRVTGNAAALPVLTEIKTTTPPPTPARCTCSAARATHGPSKPM